MGTSVMKLVGVNETNKVLDMGNAISVRKNVSVSFPVEDMISILYSLEVMNQLARNTVSYKGLKFSDWKIDEYFAKWMNCNSLTFTGKREEKDYLDRDAFHFIYLESDGKVKVKITDNDGKDEEVSVTPKILEDYELVRATDNVMSKVRGSASYVTLDTIRIDRVLAGCDANTIAVKRDDEWYRTDSRISNFVVFSKVAILDDYNTEQLCSSVMKRQLEEETDLLVYNKRNKSGISSVTSKSE